MNLDSEIQTEVSQKEKNIVYEHTYMESRKMVPMNLVAGQEWRHRHRTDSSWVFIHFLVIL